MLKKVVIIGPESTGKSTLCEMLAQHFNTQWCPEFAREYLLTNGKEYDFEDLLIIARGQLALEDEFVGMMPPSYPPIGGKIASLEIPTARLGNPSGRMMALSEIPSPDIGLTSAVPQLANFPTSQLSDFRLPSPDSGLPSAVPQLADFPTSQLSDFGLPSPDSGLPFPDFPTSRLLFIDTDQYVMKVWCEYVFHQCHNWILRRIAERPYDLYLLCKPDLPWVQDVLREYPDEKPRQELYHMYHDLLVQQHTPWIEVKGSYEERFEQAREAVAQILN